MLTNNSHLEFLEIASRQSPDASIIWLHGLGADGHDFVPLVSQLQLPAALSIRFIFPHAPYIPITINAGAAMRGWYDIYLSELFSNEDAAGIKASQKGIEELIRAELSRGVNANRILLAGFSQGGAIALYTALRFAEQLAGVVALSTYLPLAPSLVYEANHENHATPIFLAHGSYDNVIPLHAATATRDILEKAGYPVSWHEYEMAHSLCEPEILDIRAWLLEILSARVGRRPLDA